MVAGSSKARITGESTAGKELIGWQWSIISCLLCEVGHEFVISFSVKEKVFDEVFSDIPEADADHL